MNKIYIEELEDGFFSVPFLNIKKAIEGGFNLTIYYKNEKMHLAWENLASKFGMYNESPMGFETWEFKFNPESIKKDAKI